MIPVQPTQKSVRRPGLCKACGAQPWRTADPRSVRPAPKHGGASLPSRQCTPSFHPQAVFLRPVVPAWPMSLAPGLCNRGARGWLAPRRVATADPTFSGPGGVRHKVILGRYMMLRQYEGSGSRLGRETVNWLWPDSRLAGQQRCVPASRAQRCSVPPTSRLLLLRQIG